MIAFEPGPVLEALQRHRVRFVIIGGFAAILHGASYVTFDIDITPDAQTENLERLSTALRELGARVWSTGIDEGLAFDHDAASLARSGVWNLVTPHGRLDISFVPNGTTGFVDLDAGAEEHVVVGVPVRVASLADIVRSKEAAGRTKDLLVLPTLRRLLDERYPER